MNNNAAIIKKPWYVLTKDDTKGWKKVFWLFLVLSALSFPETYLAFESLIVEEGLKPNSLLNLFFTTICIGCVVLASTLIWVVLDNRHNKENKTYKSVIFFFAAKLAAYPLGVVVSVPLLVINWLLHMLIN